MTVEAFEGLVMKKQLGSGTKSEHVGMILRTQDGDYKLRRQRGNPFKDEELEKLDGCRVRCVGLLREQQIIMTSWEVIND